MAANTRTGLRAFRSLTSTVCASCRRPFSQTARALAGPRDADRPEQTMDSLLSNVEGNFLRADPNYYQNLIPGQDIKMDNLAIKDWEEDDRHKLNIYATKHNTHITLAKPNRDSLISVSCGNIGFRKAGRGSYDAGYQLAAFVMSRIKDKGLLPQIQKLELVYRGFGAGREAVTKAILGSEGKQIRPLIVKLSDSTRLKFGGVRSKKPRRLG
ncbi:mitochondrial ribosomal protein-like protein subunit S18 [Macroventuria anomochaeta]|uniref:Mitochondrial ribosomal protein-like protein subunit S18 n=1 Tax=Macroventuria anomochaeta TaxID=301207 RepID=A0ACB6SE06_9PLEO|nr:mitochondrial ribosomal protein-like protein subunit S18 [Macroventuria anomochaeta]KAF2632203.1 mitochondrial ribosomal protein-like protein subunit S18 [Macroventuria anomochaeta]